MVNLVVALRWLMCTVEIEPGSNINFWLPKKSGDKPAVLLIHGFAGDGMMTWALQVRSLSKRYSVYIPDLLFSVGPTLINRTGHLSSKPSVWLRLCVSQAWIRLSLSGLAIPGGFVAFKIAELYGNMVKAVVVSGSSPVLTGLGLFHCRISCCPKRLGKLSSFSPLFCTNPFGSQTGLYKITIRCMVF